MSTAQSSKFVITVVFWPRSHLKVQMQYHKDDLFDPSIANPLDFQLEGTWDYNSPTAVDLQ